MDSEEELENEETTSEKEIQDFNKKPVLIGADVKALYPSMDQDATSELAFRAVLESDVQYTGIDYRYLMVYLKLVLGDTEMRRIGLSHALPAKLDPDESDSLLTKKNRDLSNWRIPIDALSEKDKRLAIATMIKISVIVMSKTTCYSFGGSLYIQRTGAGIGLRASACLAKITMGSWDQAWAEIMFSWGIRCKLYMRYIDDLRLYAYPIKPGWIWTNSGWRYDSNHISNECDIRNT